MAACPHCKQEIDILTQKDIVDTYGISQSAITQRRAKDSFPEPWDKQGSRLLWLKQDLDEFFEKRTIERTSRLVGELERMLSNVPASEKKRVLEALKNA